MPIRDAFILVANGASAFDSSPVAAELPAPRALAADKRTGLYR